MLAVIPPSVVQAIASQQLQEARNEAAALHQQVTAVKAEQQQVQAEQVVAWLATCDAVALRCTLVIYIFTVSNAHECSSARHSSILCGCHACMMANRHAQCAGSHSWPGVLVLHNSEARNQMQVACLLFPCCHDQWLLQSSEHLLSMSSVQLCWLVLSPPPQLMPVHSCLSRTSLRAASRFETQCVMLGVGSKSKQAAGAPEGNRGQSTESATPCTGEGTAAGGPFGSC